MKLISWNVNGIRAAVKKEFASSFKALDADIFCLQETKAQDDQVKEALAEIDGYVINSSSAVKKGYSGTAILSKATPLNVINTIGIEEHDQEGRVVACEFDDYYVVTVYVPNSGSELARLPYRGTWDQAFVSFLKKLEEHKPVVVCGDFNVAHQEIDLARPKPNYNKSAGYMQAEIDGFNLYMNTGFVDTFRYKHPEEIKYSWWSYRAGARAKNVGWRIDYFLVSDILKSTIKSATIHNEIMGSDHCPVGLEF